MNKEQEEERRIREALYELPEWLAIIEKDRANHEGIPAYLEFMVYMRKQFPPEMA